MHVKTGDTVKVISGKDRGKTGKVLEVSPKEGKVIVEDINIVTKHVKPRRQGDAGGIVKAPAPMYAAKVMLYCGKCKKPTRIAHRITGDKKVRVCKHCGAEL
ncbi:MAG: 50S ribosomal protein L24 [Clostridiales bacterium]|nr:50S ribosomal protein L24 [Clostridiales bacterium]